LVVYDGLDLDVGECLPPLRIAMCGPRTREAFEALRPGQEAEVAAEQSSAVIWMTGSYPAITSSAADSSTCRQVRPMMTAGSASAVTRSLTLAGDGRDRPEQTYPSHAGLKKLAGSPDASPHPHVGSVVRLVEADAEQL
jgi:hypothetical protein